MLNWGVHSAFTLAVMLALAHLLCSCKTSHDWRQAAIAKRNENRPIKVVLVDGGEIIGKAHNEMFKEALLDSTLRLTSSKEECNMSKLTKFSG